MKKIKRFYSRYKDYFKVDLLMYIILVLMIIIYFVWFYAFR